MTGITRVGGFLVDDVEDFVHRAASGFCLRPTCELFRDWIQRCHPRFGIRRNHRIADGVERDG